MRLSSSLCSCCLLLLLLWSAHGWAATTLSLRSAHWPGMSLQGLQARLDNQADQGIGLVMQISQLNIERVGWRRVGLQVHGVLTRDPNGRWRFEGEVACHGAPGNGWGHAQLTVLVNTLTNSLFARVWQDQVRLSAAVPLDQPSHWQIGMQQLPAAWLRAGSDDGRANLFGNGVLTGKLALDLDEDGLSESGIFRVDGLGLNLPVAGFAGTDLDGHVQVNARLDGRGHVRHARLQAQLQRGHLSLQGWQAHLPAQSALRLGLEALAAEHGGSDVRVYWDDPGALRFDGRLKLDPHGKLRELSVEHLGMNLAAAYQHYGASLGASDAAGPALTVAGGMTGSLTWYASGWRALNVHLHDVELGGARLPLAVQGLQGTLDWRLHGVAPTTSLQWQRLTLLGVEQPAGGLQMQSRDSQLRLLSPWRIALWGGQMTVNSLSVSPQAAGLQWSLLANLDKLRLDGPARSLGLAMPPLSWSQGGVAMHGDLRQWSIDSPLQASLWGGSLTAHEVRLQSPGVQQPWLLSAQLQFDQLDLQAFSAYADLGLITGTVRGQVDGLQWRQGSGPQAFRLSVRSQGGGRISQRAISVLSALTGSGAASGLQGMMLKVFRAPAYVRLGLDAQLLNGSLLLDGIDHDGHGYTLVEGRGLPWVRLSGRDTQLAWPQALRRVRAALSGHAGSSH